MSVGLPRDTSQPVLVNLSNGTLPANAIVSNPSANGITLLSSMSCAQMSLQAAETSSTTGPRKDLQTQTQTYMPPGAGNSPIDSKGAPVVPSASNTVHIAPLNGDLGG